MARLLGSGWLARKAITVLSKLRALKPYEPAEQKKGKTKLPRFLHIRRKNSSVRQLTKARPRWPPSHQLDRTLNWMKPVESRIFVESSKTSIIRGFRLAKRQDFLIGEWYTVCSNQFLIDRGGKSSTSRASPRCTRARDKRDWRRYLLDRCKLAIELSFHATNDVVLVTEIPVACRFEHRSLG